MLDAFALHTRNLFDFFYPKKHRHSDDVIVNQYLTKSASFKVNKTKKKDLLFISKKTDKQVAHLTYSRNRYSVKTKPWQFQYIVEKMHNTIKAFYESLPDDYKKWRYFSNLKKLLDYNDFNINQ